MRLHRFFIDRSQHAGENIREGGEITVLDAELLHQLRRVFRFTAGDSVILFDGTGFDYVSEIVSFGNEEVIFRVTKKGVNQNVPKREVYLFASLIKNNNYEWILEKCTELGVMHFVPIVSERSEKKNLRFDRAERIVKEASEQSGRGALPRVYETVTLHEMFDTYTIPFVAFDWSGESVENFKLQITNAKENKIGVLVGPEGGWSEGELALFKEKKVPVYSLGTQVLRAETAAVAVSSLVLI